MIENAELERDILRLEEELLKTEVRCSKEKLSKLLTKDFIEFCSSGKVYVYEENQIIDVTKLLIVVCLQNKKRILVVLKR